MRTTNKLYIEVPHEEGRVKVIATYDGGMEGLCSVICTTEILPLVRYNWGQDNLDLFLKTEALTWDEHSIIEYKTPETHKIEFILKYPSISFDNDLWGTVDILAN